MASSMPSTFANGVASAATYTVGAVHVILSVAVVALVVALIVVVLTLKAVGFTAGGPAAGSPAAAWMRSTAIANGGAVPAGSLYSVVQATAMATGVLLRAPAVLVVGSVAVVVAGAVLWKAWF